MLIQKLPHNCSAYYMHQVSEFDDIKVQTAGIIQKDVALGLAGRRIAAILATTLKANKRVMEGFAAAGFHTIAEYVSHNHGNRVVVVLFRRVTRKEFDTGKAIWPRRKNVKPRRA